MDPTLHGSVGFTPEEIRTGEPTRSAGLKWVVVVDSAMAAGLAVNAAACVATATAAGVRGLLGSDATDASGSVHPGLPWSGCSVLGASSEQLVTVREKASGAAGVFVADMPVAAQETRVYDEYVESVARTGGDQLRYWAVSVIGPRKQVDKIVARLSLLT